MQAAYSLCLIPLGQTCRKISFIRCDDSNPLLLPFARFYALNPAFTFSFYQIISIETKQMKIREENYTKNKPY